MKQDKTINAFFALVRAGLWADANHNVDLTSNPNDKVDWEEVYQLAEVMAEGQVPGMRNHQSHFFN